MSGALCDAGTIDFVARHIRDDLQCATEGFDIVAKLRQFHIGALLELRDVGPLETGRGGHVYLRRSSECQQFPQLVRRDKLFGTLCNVALFVPRKRLDSLSRSSIFLLQLTQMFVVLFVRQIDQPLIIEELLAHTAP
ncbi:hypothetical protein [Rhizobium alvei]|uniref:Uncharacterized protein n=1 Tax=Rhizobium alvei TaxID=1132659 RepID=A0ABT8YQV7_9HYPH|nr:hypothetical protein [Rhizobium alvei]MDO6966118.1 hypothetical protein [Rhizobium alvei]